VLPSDPDYCRRSDACRRTTARTSGGHRSRALCAAYVPASEEGDALHARKRWV
jgi:hypothetical protein